MNMDAIRKQVCALDLGREEDTVYFEGRCWKIPHEEEAWKELRAQLPADCELVWEGRCTALEVVFAAYAMYSLDPGRSKKIREALKESKDDASDAELLAQLRQLKGEVFKRIEAREPQLQSLRDLTRARREAVQFQTQLLQQLQSVRPKGKRTESEWLNGFQDTLHAGMVQVLISLREHVSHLEKIIKEEGEQVEACKILRTIKGMGPNMSAEITAELEGFKDLDKGSKAQCYGGTAPVTFSSGKFKAVRLRRRCNHRARNALYLFANNSKLFHGWARQYYDAARQRGKQHRDAVLALANRWVAILVAMVQSNTGYDPTRKQFHAT